MKEEISHYLKLFTRLVIIGYVIYITYMVLDPVYIKTVDDINKSLMQVIIVTVFSALTLILNWHFSKKISGDNDISEIKKLADKIKVNEDKTKKYSRFRDVDM